MNATRIKAISLDDRADLVEDAVEQLLGIADPDDMMPMGYSMEAPETDNDIDDADQDRCVEVYDDTVIICTENAYWQAAYTLDMATGAVTIAPREEWTQVENQWTPTTGGAATADAQDATSAELSSDVTTAGGGTLSTLSTTRPHNGLVHVKALTADTATVSGYGVIFGGEDLTGETFTPATDYMLNLAPTKLVFYDHTLGDVKHVIGKTVSVEPRRYRLVKRQRGPSDAARGQEHHAMADHRNELDAYACRAAYARRGANQVTIRSQSELCCAFAGGGPYNRGARDESDG
jgi:hypothetical protein